MSYIPTPASTWNRITCDAIFYAKFGPTMAARALAIVHTAMFDAWTSYTETPDRSTTTGYWLQRPPEECTRPNREKAYSYAAYRALCDVLLNALPAEHKSMFEDYMCELGYDVNDNSMDLTKPQGIGNLSAKLIIESRHGDGANQLGSLSPRPYSDYTGYVPFNTVDTVNNKYKWQPLRKPDGSAQSFLTPFWGAVHPFALPSRDAVRPDLPIFDDDNSYSELAKAAVETRKNLTDRQKMIAEYWAGLHDDLVSDVPDASASIVPPAQLCKIARYISRKRENNNARDIRLFFLVSNALLDASIATWEAKRFYDYARPITVVREYFCGQDIEAWTNCEGEKITVPAQDWQSYIPTPPFPEYTSGHSAFSAATAEIITSYYDWLLDVDMPGNVFGGSRTFPPCSSKIEPDCVPKEAVTLCWDTLQEAAEEAGMSRVYGGIHFDRGNEYGRQLGKDVAACVWEKGKYYFGH
jgi:hypothetical protein